MNRPISPAHAASTIAMERHPQNRRRLGVLLLLLFALITGMAAALFVPSLLGHRDVHISTTPVATVAHKSTPIPTRVVTQPSTPIPQGYPHIAGTYNGTINDALGPVSGKMSLAIKQQHANIRGNFIVSGRLTGSGPFSGYVTNKNYIQFIVQSRGVNPLFFYGAVQANGDLGGSYCSLDATGRCNANVGGYGTWLVVPGPLDSETRSSFHSQFSIPHLHRSFHATACLRLCREREYF
jgi:hypothetical protein